LIDTSILAQSTPVPEEGGDHLIALRRVGIEMPRYGAHVLRHSAATGMLREGMSLSSIGVVLRHASIETTAVYAKVDVPRLRAIARPWPEVATC